MNKTAIKNFAVWAREKLIADITYKAGTLGITEDGIAEKLPHSTEDLHFFQIGKNNYVEVSGSNIAKRNDLVNAIRKKERDNNNYKEAFQYIVEEVAYTWFNRLIAIRFMEVNEYLPSGVRVLSSENKAKNEPDFVTAPFDTDLQFTPYEQDRVVQLKDENKLDELFRMLFIKQCNKLHDILPKLFEKTDDFSELLLTISFTDSDGVVYHLTHDIDENDFNIEKEGQVEIIGWMYQYYNIEPKAAVFARASGTKIKKEEIPAATQLFTPDWIVRYMVDNSLGRLWINGHPESNLKEQLSYLLSEASQDEDVKNNFCKIKISHQNIKPEDIKVIDPCMGSGHILVYAFDVLMKIYESYGYTQRDAASLIVENNLFGLDVDERATQLAYFAVMMKGREYDRRFLSRNIQIHIYDIPECDVSPDDLAEKFDECSDVAKRLCESFANGKEYGSLISPNVSVSELNALEDKINQIENPTDYEMNYDLFTQMALNIVKPLIDVAKSLINKYDIVVTNPPYMAVSNGGAKLNEFVKLNYPDSKADMFCVFMEKGFEMAKPTGYNCMVTMQSWMFLSSFEKIRERFVSTKTITNLMHMENMVMGIAFGTAVSIFNNTLASNYKGVYNFVKLSDIENDKPRIFPNKDFRYVEVSPADFQKIPGTPIAYWVSKQFASAYEHMQLCDIGDARSGLQTGNNELFLKLWFEVNNKNIAFNCRTKEEYLKQGCKWTPQIKGGSYRRWYGNFDYIVNWENDGFEIRQCKGCRLNAMANDELFFKKGITWSHTTSGIFGARFLPEGSLFNVEAPTYFVNDENLYYVLGMLNTCVSQAYLSATNSTVHYLVGNIIKLPIIESNSHLLEVNALVKDNINISKLDWDSFETSWDFKMHPLVAMRLSGAYSWGDEVPVAKLSSAYKSWEMLCEGRFNKLKANEEELNRIFIEIYGLQDELTAEVLDKNISVYKADLQNDIKSLISYAVGCMFGRYSIDGEGIAYAGGTWDNSKYRSFMPDKDNCIPITDEEYFEDDIVGLFCKWLKVVYGEKTLEENLDFIAKALGKKGKTNREIIRNYFLEDFFKDHFAMYSVTGAGKRPIYWLFDSGKQNGFKALCYMHRWSADTIGNMRVEYLHRMQRVYDKEIERMQEVIDNSRDNKEISAASKRKEKLQKQIKETKDYDALVAHLALSRIGIDLDDGVKVNYDKVQTAPDGKKMQILAKI